MLCQFVFFYIAHRRLKKNSLRTIRLIEITYFISRHESLWQKLPFALVSVYKHRAKRSLNELLGMNIPLCTGNTCVFQNVSLKIPYVKLLLFFFCWLLICVYLFIYYIRLICFWYEIWICYNNVQCEHYVIEM